MKKILKIVSTIFSTYQLTYLFFIVRHKYIPKFENPRSLSEKINYIKLFNRNPLRIKIVDRLSVRTYVQEISSKCKLPNILWHGERIDQNVWDILPERFVIKANHGSKMTIVVDKREMSFDQIKEETEKWMKNDYAKYGREWMYSKLEKYLLVEEKLELNENVPPDFKFFVLNHRVELIQVDFDRFKGHSRNIYTREFGKIDGKIVYNNYDADFLKPANLDEAIRIAEELSRDFDLIRVDLYILPDEIYFGELTNTPGNGFEKITPKQLDFDLGAKLPKKILN